MHNLYVARPFVKVNMTDTYVHNHCSYKTGAVKTLFFRARRVLLILMITRADYVLPPWAPRRLHTFGLIYGNLFS